MKIKGTMLIVLGMIFLVGGIACSLFFFDRVESAEKKLMREAYVEFYNSPVDPWGDRAKDAKKREVVMMRTFGYGGYVVSFVGLILIIAYIRWLMFLKKIGFQKKPVS